MKKPLTNEHKLSLSADLKICFRLGKIFVTELLSPLNPKILLIPVSVILVLILYFAAFSKQDIPQKTSLDFARIASLQGEYLEMNETYFAQNPEQFEKYNQEKLAFKELALKN